jgi:hypothetical protein
MKDLMRDSNLTNLRVGRTTEKKDMTKSRELQRHTKKERSTAKLTVVQSTKEHLILKGKKTEDRMI